VKAAFTPYKQKLEAIMKAIQGYGSVLALEASLASEISEHSSTQAEAEMAGTWPYSLNTTRIAKYLFCLM
jgi:hypothetical protein